MSSRDPSSTLDDAPVITSDEAGTSQAGIERTHSHLATAGGHRPTRRRLADRASYATVVAALVLVFVGSGAPVPLYATYRREFAVSSGDLALTTVVYLAVTAAALLVLGRLSDVLGRRPVAIAAVVCAAIGLLVLTRVDGLAPLVVGRLLQGLACGTATSALGTYALELAPARPAWAGPVVTANAPAFAIPFGALVSGTLVQYAPQPRQLVYLLVAVALGLCAIALGFCRDTVQRTTGVRAALRPRVQLPAGQGWAVLAVSGGLVATWSLSGFFQAFSPTLTVDQLGSTSALLAAVVFACIVVLSPLGGALGGRLAAPRTLAVGMVVFAVAAVVIVVAVHASATVALLVACLVGGIALGAIGGAGMRLMLAGAEAHQRAGIISTVYLISYSGAVRWSPSPRSSPAAAPNNSWATCASRGRTV
ncbi:MFS transporter [Cellulomonas endophytica]|uniref:MFS transporter n=1 Tax=Cellulomonas endophytica TaxID=2494735 RepID=UPI001011AD1C|nr:MFS transporter [Cellulomonas endophytica]